MKWTLSACIVTQHVYNAALPKLPQTKLCQILTSCWYFALFNYWSQRLISVGTLPVSQCKHSTKNNPGKALKGRISISVCHQSQKIKWREKSPPKQENNHFLFWPKRDMSGCRIRSHYHPHTPVCHPECHDTAEAWEKLDVIQEC